MGRAFTYRGIAIVGLLLATASASAESVSFTTAFDFDAGPGVSNSVALNGATFTLTGADVSGQSAPASDVFFGWIDFVGGSSPAVDSALFDFTVAQSAPLPGGSGTSVGNDFSIAVLRKGGLAEITVLGGSVTIGNVTYTLADQSFAFTSAGREMIVGSISVDGATGSVNAMPVPAAVWGGVSLLGLLGGGRWWSRRRALS